MSIGFWLGVAAFLIVGMGVANAQYTGAQPYVNHFGYGVKNYDDAVAMTVKNSSAHDMTIVIVDHWPDTVVDHVFVAAYSQHTFYDLPATSYCYRLEVNGTYKKLSDPDKLEKCPEGYRCDPYTITFDYIQTAGGSSEPISKQDFFN